jgi:hypothetical protein
LEIPEEVKSSLIIKTKIIADIEQIKGNQDQTGVFVPIRSRDSVEMVCGAKALVRR